MKKEPKTFHDENGEPFRIATFKECFLFSLVCWFGLIGLIALIWLSRCFTNFLKTMPQ